MSSSPADPANDPALRRELQACRDALAMTERARLAFLAQISHELRTPMNAVMGFAQLMLRDRRDPLSDGNRMRAEQLLLAGDELLTLFDTLTDIEQLACGAARLSLEPVVLGPMLDDCVNRLRPRADRAQVALSGPPRCLGICVALADRLRLNRVLGGLLSGALRYSQPGARMGAACGCPDSPADIARPEAVVTMSLVGQGFAPMAAEPLIAAMRGRLEVPDAGDGATLLRISLPRAPAQWCAPHTG